MWIYKILIYGGVILKKAMIYVHGNGNRTDVRWAKFTDHSGAGIFVESNRAFQFSIIPFSDITSCKSAVNGKL